MKDDIVRDIKYVKIFKYNIIRIFKSLSIIIMIIIVIILYIRGKNPNYSIKVKIKNNNIWFQKNLTEFLNNYLSVFHGKYFQCIHLLINLNLFINYVNSFNYI